MVYKKKKEVYILQGIMIIRKQTVQIRAVVSEVSSFVGNSLHKIVRIIV